MPRISVVKTSKIIDTFRVASVQGKFDIPRRDEETVRFDVDLPLDEKHWNIGLIVGPSGAGKTTVANEMWPGAMEQTHSWTEPSLIDDFPKNMTPTEVTDLLVSVGFSSTPAWLRPYRVLSTGQKFRCDLAMALAQKDLDRPVVFDEFTSTVDRIVAKASSVAVAKHVRRTGKQFVAVTCHYDVMPWLQPDWVLDMATGKFSWRSVQSRPKFRFTVTDAGREGRATWPVFRGHHYLSGDLHRAARVFLAYVTIDGSQQLVGFFAILSVAGHKGWWRGHRTVVLPDFQGLGIGNRMIEAVADQLWERERKRFRATTSAYGLIQHRKRHPEMWRLTQKSGHRPKPGKTASVTKHSTERLTTSWVYIPTGLR